ncbi:MAG: methyltransferase [Pseudomonadota bacterium]
MPAFAIALAVLALTAHHEDGMTMAGRIEAAMYGDHRAEAHVVRNQHRHPVGTLTFLGLHEDMDVLELWPGGGWYMEILAPVLKDGGGSYTAAAYDPDIPDQPQYRYRQWDAMHEKWQARPDIYANAKVIKYTAPNTENMGVEATYDMVLTFRNMHGLVNGGNAEKVMGDAFGVLTPGGVMGVIQHRAEPGTDPMETSPKGYVSEEAIIAIAEKVGFKLAGRSEVNANPMDTKDYDDGVWTLPPSLRKGDEDREKYVAIGESDRMTLKFYKPEI